MFISFLICLLAGFPIAYVLAGVGVLFAGIGSLSDKYFDTITGLDFTTLGLVVNRIYKLMDNWILIALPMFIFMGVMLEKSGVAEHAMKSTQTLFGKVKGGLGVTVTIIGMILAASTGVIGASVVLLGVLSLPVMLAQGYKKTFTLGTIASAGTLGILIPPSIMLIIMADQLGLSVGDLFMGALLPGILLGVLYIVYILIYSFLNSEAAPLSADTKCINLTTIWQVFKNIIPLLALTVAVLGSIFTGVATVTEASGVGALGSIVLALYFKSLNFRILRDVLHSTFTTTAYIFAILIGATCFSLVLRELGGDELIEKTFVGLPFSSYGIIASILFVIFILGFVLDWIEITLIALPLLAPIVSSLGFEIDSHGVIEQPELIWFVMLIAIVLQTSFLTPPVGFALFCFI